MHILFESSLDTCSPFIYVYVHVCAHNNYSLSLSLSLIPLISRDVRRGVTNACSIILLAACERVSTTVIA
jgi:hypothetical protein